MLGVAICPQHHVAEAGRLATIRAAGTFGSIMAQEAREQQKEKATYGPIFGEVQGQTL